MANKRSDRLKQCHVRMDENTYQRVAALAKENETTVNEVVLTALDRYVASERGYYDIPDILVQRTNQLVDVVMELTSRLDIMERNISGTLNEIATLAHGDNYLLEEE